MIYKAKPPQPTEAVSPAELGLERRDRHADDRRTHARARGREGRARALEGLRHPGGGLRTSRAGTPSSASEGGACWLVDLDSTNGIEVNGKRVKRAKLEDGDTITARRRRSSSSGKRDEVARSTSSTSTRRSSSSRSRFLVLLYLFIWRIVRSASRDLRRPRRRA